jgi:hypothetical protein
MSGKERTAATDRKAFDCPHCGAFSLQRWYELAARIRYENTPPHGDPAPPARALDSAGKPMGALAQVFTGLALHQYESTVRMGNVLPSNLERRVLENLFASHCYACASFSVWIGRQLVYPPARIGPAPNEDLPAEIAADFEEARSIVELSPRGAAALLRLAIEKLCAHLGAPGDRLNEQIGWLVSNKGLEEIVQQALDAVRVTGNNSVHAGKLDPTDDRDTALELFELVNLIADQQITRLKRVAAAYAKIPPEKLAAIKRRDGKTQK